MDMTHRIFIQRLLIILGVLAGAALLWRLSGMLLLVFAAVVFAVIIGALRQLIERFSPLKGAMALTVAVLGVFAILAGVFTLFGSQIVREFATIQAKLPAAIAAVERQLDGWGLGDRGRALIEQGSGDLSAVLTNAGGVVLSAGSGIADFLLVLVGGIFLAAQPDLYRRGLVALVPKRGEALAAQAVEDSGRALHLWLRGQLLSMAVVTLLTGVGLWALGVPAALGLALIAGLLDFVPFVGPIIAAIPAVLLAFTQGPTTALYTVILFLVVQQIQGNILQPLVQRHAVDVPPAVLIFSVAAAGVLFGLIGVFLAAPLTVVVFVLVQRLYVQAALGKDITVASDA